MVLIRFMQVAVFHATQVSSWVVLREAFSAAMHRAPLRRAAHDRMSSLHVGGQSTAPHEHPHKKEPGVCVST